MVMHPSHLRILQVLNVEKHLTARQITEILYPAEANQGERAYQRIASNLQSLRAKSLLSSKAYDLNEEYFWALRKHPVIEDLELEPPRAEVHSHFYHHEKACADVFVALYKTGSLHGWGHQQISKNIKPDRIFYLGDDLYYLEVEMGNHKEATIRNKIENYKKHHRETGEKFQVRFVTPKKKAFDMMYRIMEHETYHYQAYMLETLQAASNTYSNTHSEHVESEIALNP